MMEDKSCQYTRTSRVNSTQSEASVMPCPLCTKRLSNPLTLPCEHTYCTPCINDLNGAGAGRPECCVCGTTFTLVEQAEPGCEPCVGEHSMFFANHYLPVTDASDDPGEPMTEVCKVETIPRVKVMGMAWWNDQLYVIYHRKPAVYVYNIQCTAPFRVHQVIHPAALNWPRGIAVDGCTGSSYIVDWTHVFSGTLWKMPTNGSVEKIADVGVQPFGISLADNGNAIIVTGSHPVWHFMPVVGNSSQIIIYTPIGTIREIMSLSNELEIPRHALRIDRGSYSEYFVIHGWGHKRGQVVCVRSALQDEKKIPLSSEGQIKQGSYGSSDSVGDQSLCKPLSLLNDGNDGIFVVDHANNRIHLLNSQLQFLQHILTGINRPRHIALDGRRGVLFVGLESGEIRAFQIKPKACA